MVASSKCIETPKAIKWLKTAKNHETHFVIRWNLTIHKIFNLTNVFSFLLFVLKFSLKRIHHGKIWLEQGKNAAKLNVSESAFYLAHCINNRIELWKSEFEHCDVDAVILHLDIFKAWPIELITYHLLRLIWPLDHHFDAEFSFKWHVNEWKQSINKREINWIERKMGKMKSLWLNEKAVQNENSTATTTTKKRPDFASEKHQMVENDVKKLQLV